jgi:NitT/TauT family transport system ATP-binding protein
MAETKIEIRRVGRTFTLKRETRVALQGIDLSVAANEFVALVGASGCGKSTLLRIVGGLESASSGEVRVNGRAVTGPGADRAMVFQDYSLYPWLTVLENIRFSRQLWVNRRDTSVSAASAAVERSYALLEIMGLSGVKSAYPNQLSGGMRQRVAIARALLAKPEVLLMDEPFGALDAQTREVMHDLILHLYQRENSTVLFVTHDVEEAIYLAGRVVVLAPQPGRIDCVYDVPLPEPQARTLDMKMAPEFLRLKQAILHRIRETSGVYTDIALLHRLTGGQAKP